MNNPKTEEIVKALRYCSTSNSCASCTLMHHDNGCVEFWMSSAADLIEQLQQELVDERYRHDRLQDFCVAQGEELEARQRWIPVTEPPPKQEHVWIYYKNWAGKWVCNVGWWSGDVWYHHDDTPGPYGWGMAHEVPTHWMPLPEPPKE